MNEDRLLELVPLAALGALDGEDRAAFEAEAGSSAAVQSELQAFQELVGRLGLATAPVPPTAALRGRVLSAVAPARPPRSLLVPALAAGLVAAVAGLVLLWHERDTARREADAQHAAAQDAREAVLQVQKELAALRERLEREAAFRALASDPHARVVSLAGLAAAPGASARVVWHSERREAVLAASGLAPAPAGRVYEVWVIGLAAPVAAGLFHVDEKGQAVVRLTAVADLARVTTFAVTIEPEGGTRAPTGPMVLAGAVS